MKSSEPVHVPQRSTFFSGEAALDLLDDFVLILDTNRQIIFVNRALKDFSLLKAGSDFFENIHPDDRLNLLSTLNAISYVQPKAQFLTRLADRSERYHTLEGSAARLTFENSLEGFMITFRQRADTQLLDDMRADLEQNKKIIEAVVDSTISMISVVDRQLRYVLFNQKTEEYTDVDGDAILGKNVFDVFPHLRETDFESLVKRALQGETVYSETSKSLLKKGRYFETYFIPLQIGTHIDHVIVKVRDKTSDITLRQRILEANAQLQEQNRELKRQSQFIESLFDSTIDIIAVIDKEFRYLSINKRAEERYRISKSDIRGKKIIELFPTVESSGMYRDIQRAFKGEVVYDLGYTSEVLDQSHFQNYYVPLRDDRDEVYAVMVIGHDITELQNTAEQLRISNTELADKNRELERSNSDLEQFAYVASHDLQEPVRKIATYANKLLTRSGDNFSEETRVYLQRINKSTRRMYELINGLLLYSRLTREEALFTAVSIQEVIQHITVDFELPIRQKKAVISFQGLPTIEAVPVQMNQLFSNLINNSLKFSKGDAPPVTQLAATDLTGEQKRFYDLNPKARYVNIFYLDNGIGFDQQYAEKVFELFQRLHERNQYEGSGIGLAICKKIVNNHHGFISAFSEENKGATFQIILPYQQKPFV